MRSGGGGGSHLLQLLRGLMIVLHYFVATYMYVNSDKLRN